VKPGFLVIHSPALLFLELWYIIYIGIWFKNIFVLQGVLPKTKTNIHQNKNIKVSCFENRRQFLYWELSFVLFRKLLYAKKFHSRRRDIMKNFISLARKYQEYLVGCSFCDLIWIRETPPKEIFWEISSAILKLNEQRLSPSELFSHDILISHTVCPECVAHSPSGENIRAKQIREGNFPCFGSANHGYCDQGDCKYRYLCIWDENLHPQKMAYYSCLYERMVTRQSPVFTILRV
jgi:hypothetical protein